LPSRISSTSTGNPVSVWKTVTGRVWGVENEGAKLGQFAQTDLANFHKTMDALAQLVSSLYGLPPHYLGFSTDNPAPQRRSSRPRPGSSSGPSANRACSTSAGSRSCAWLCECRPAPGTRPSSGWTTAWRDPSTPTIAQAADAAVKTYQAGIVPLRFTRRRLGFNDAEIAQMEQEDAEAAAQKAALDPLGQMTRALGQGSPDGQPVTS
jgi:hypothetical protein